MSQSLKKMIATISAEYGVTFEPVKIALWANGLQCFPDHIIERAVYAHIQNPDRGRFAPRLAEIIGNCDALSPGAKWLGAEEAWSQMPRGEGESAMLTNEAAEALAAANDLIAAGDKVAARMAFKEAYERLVAKAKMEGRRPAYFFSAGRDMDGREKVLVDAVRNNLIAADHVPKLLPPDRVEGVLRSAGVTNHPLLAPPSNTGKAKVRELLLTLKGKVAA
jgi:hypothetical protein